MAKESDPDRSGWHPYSLVPLLAVLGLVAIVLQPVQRDVTVGVLILAGMLVFVVLIAFISRGEGHSAAALTKLGLSFLLVVRCLCNKIKL